MSILFDKNREPEKCVNIDTCDNCGECYDDITICINCKQYEEKRHDKDN